MMMTVPHFRVSIGIRTKGALYLAGTDGYRLAERRLVETTSEGGGYHSGDHQEVLLRTLSEDVKEVEILFDESQVRLHR